MGSNQQWRRIVLIVAPLSVVLASAYIGLSLGVEEKSWWERAWGFIAGGSLGAIVGIGFFILVGAIGWVSGPLFGAVGLVGLAAGGIVGGMGLGSIIDIARRPQNYNFHVTTILVALTIGLLAACALYAFLDRRLPRSKLQVSSEANGGL